MKDVQNRTGDDVFQALKNISVCVLPKSTFIYQLCQYPAQNILRIFWKKLINQIKLHKNEKLWYLFFFQFFWAAVPKKLSLPVETEHKAAPPCNIGIVLIFSYFFRLQVLRRLATLEATCIYSFSYQVLFYLWWMETVLNFVKFSNIMRILFIMNRIVWKISFATFVFKMIQISEYSTILTEIRAICQKRCHLQKVIAF